MSGALRADLSRLFDRYGVDRVIAESQELAAEMSTVQGSRRSSPSSQRQAKVRRTRARLSAPQYVAKLDVEDEKTLAVRELAERFEAKSFLPRCADIRNFCHIYGLDEQTARSRTGAIPRLFKHLAAMEAEDLNTLLNERTFSGPSRLGPLAETIREHGRARAARGRAELRS